MTDHADYLTNVWRLLFTCTREQRGWEPIEDRGLYDRIFTWGISIGRDLDADLDSAQVAVDAGKKREEWIEEHRREPASA